jgi:hypothetical protein
MFTNIENPVWANEENTAIDCTVTHEKYGIIPFTASKNDSEEHGKTLFDELFSGMHGPIAAYVPPPPPPPESTATDSSGSIPARVL